MQNRFTSPITKTGAGVEEKKPLSVIIPAAGMGHRMKSYGPKCLLPANNKDTILQKIVKNIQREYPYSDIVVVTGFESEKVIKSLPHNIRIVENNDYETTNTVESIRVGINACATDNVLIVYGDLVFNVYSIRNITSNGSCAIIDSKSQFKNEEVGVTVVDDKVTRFAYGLQKKWSQIAFFENEEFKMLKDLCSDRRKNKLYPFELFNFMIGKGCTIKSIEPKGMIIKEIDSLKDL